MIELCPDFASPEANVACPPDLHLIDPVARFTPPDLLPFTGFDPVYLWVALGAAAFVLVGVLVIVVVTDRGRQE